MLLQDHLKACCERGAKQIEWLLNLEKPPYTSNPYHFGSYQKKFLAHYRSARHMRFESDSDIDSPRIEYEPIEVSYESSRRSTVAQILSGLARIGISVREEDLPKLLPGDQMDPALGIMADVRAYFQGTGLSTPLSLADHLFQLPIGVSPTTSRWPSTSSSSKDWAREPPAVAVRREELKKKLERLQGARIELMQINL